MPKPFKKTIAIAPGAINLSTKIKAVINPLDSFEPLANSSSILSRPQYQPIKRDIKSPPNGNSIFAEIQSSKSKKFKPNIVCSLNKPIDKEQKMPTIEIITVAKIVAKVLLIFNSSLK